MDLQNARQIIDTLAQGVHPVTGEVMPDDSPYNAPPVIRALFAVSQALHVAPRQRVRPTMPNAGKPWTAEADAQLEAGMAAGQDLKALSQASGRTQWAVQSRLLKLGHMPPR